MKERLRGVILSEDAAFYLICLQCFQVLYEPESDDPTTRMVARFTADSHRKAFSEPHEVSAFDGQTTKEISNTENPGSFLHNELPA